MPSLGDCCAFQMPWVGAGARDGEEGRGGEGNPCLSPLHCLLWCWVSLVGFFPDVSFSCGPQLCPALGCLHCRHTVLSVEMDEDLCFHPYPDPAPKSGSLQSPSHRAPPRRPFMRLTALGTKLSFLPLILAFIALNSPLLNRFLRSGGAWQPWVSSSPHPLAVVAVAWQQPLPRGLGGALGARGALLSLYSDFLLLSFFFSFFSFFFFIAPIFLFYEREAAGFSQGWEERSVPCCSQPDGGEGKGRRRGSPPGRRVCLVKEALVWRLGCSTVTFGGDSRQGEGQGMASFYCSLPGLRAA